jgi:hypothetical protein
MGFRKWYKAFLFLVILTGSLFLLEKLFDFGIKHNLNLKSSYVATHKIDAQLLVLGPCEPLWMVSPEILTRQTGLSCYNLANSHSDFADNYLHLQLYLQNNKVPESLLLYVTPESFDTNYNTFHTYRFAQFLNDKMVNKVVTDCCPQYSPWKRLPFFNYGYYGHQTCFLALQGWKHYLTGKQKPYYADGFEPPAKVVWDNHHENLKKAYPSGYSFSWDSLRERYFQRILSVGKAHNIKIILYESPVLREIAEYQVNRTLFLERIEKIAEKHNIPFLKFDELPWAKDRKYFISPMVTTLQGSYLFSDTLAKALKAQLLE